ITYTDTPCPADTTTQYFDPAASPWLNESSQTMNTFPALPDATSQSEPEVLAILCANDEFRVWLKAQRHALPERDARTAKFIRLSYLCRKALHLPGLAAPIPQIPLKRVVGQQMPRWPILSRSEGAHGIYAGDRSKPRGLSSRPARCARSKRNAPCVRACP